MAPYTRVTKSASALLPSRTLPPRFSCRQHLVDGKQHLLRRGKVVLLVALNYFRLCNAIDDTAGNAHRLVNKTKHVCTNRFPDHPPLMVKGLYCKMVVEKKGIKDLVELQ